MTQRKLTDDELTFAKQALFELGKVSGCWEVYSKLRDMVREGTTDGQPYVDPVPPIPDGYRLAVAGDEVRADCMIWRGKERDYVPRWNSKSAASHCEFQPNETYIVPADRTPTDEDAKSRPAVMVLDCDGTDWEKQKLVFVNGCADAVRKFVTVDSDSQCAYEWKYCRHLYPGE